MRAEPGPTIRLLLSDIGVESFCSTLQKLSACFGELGSGASLAPTFIHIDPRQLAEKGARPLPLHELAQQVDELARRYAKVSFITRLEGSSLAHTWQVSITTTRIPILIARRVSIHPSARNYEGEIAWAKDSLRKATLHLVVTASPDYSEFSEWALPQCFYLFQKIANVPQLKRMAEAEHSTGSPNPIWPVPTELADAVASRLGAEPLLIPESERERGKLVQQLDECLLNHVSKTALDTFLSNLGVPFRVWFR